MIIKQGKTTVEDTNDNLIENDEGITCGCNNPKMTMQMHLDCSDKAITSYRCQCGNQICVTTTRKMF